MRIFSIGHGTRSFEAFLQTLAAGGVQQVADVRSFPGSRRNPQFGREHLTAALRATGLGYWWLPRLGGRRRLERDSPNTAWSVDSFRAYADYTDSDEFRHGIAELLDLAASAATAMMCAETHPSRCHRRIIADKLCSLGHEVIHLIEPDRAEPHRPTSFLRLEGEHLRYDLSLEGEGNLFR